MTARRIVAALVGALALSAAFGAGWLLGQQGWEPQALLHRVAGLPSAPVERARFQPPSPPEPGEAAVLFVGDVLPLADRDYLGAARPLLQGADLAICNLECPLSTHGAMTPLKLDDRGRAKRNEYLFRAPPSQAKRLSDAGFDAVTLANNHVMDYGAQALLETLDHLDHAGLQHTGAGADEEAARRPLILQAAGQTIAVLAYVSASTLPGIEHFAATQELAGTVFVHGDGHGRPREQTRALLRNDLAAAREHADFVVVCLHWGREAGREPKPLQSSLAHWCIDCGADMVVGHHPHVLQGVELYRGRPIAYSLGNFAFPTRWESNHYSGALELRLRDGDWRRLVIHPVKLRFQAGDPAPAEGDDLEKIVRRVTSLSEELGTTAEFVSTNGPPRIIIANQAEPAPRRELLRAEAACFHIEPHPELQGMSTVHFLGWDIEGGDKVRRDLSVVVNANLAEQTLEIFREIYLDPERFPIHEVIGYDYRTVAGGSGLSWHAYGRAIDINRAENPMIEDGQKVVHPDERPYEPGEWRPGEDPYSITPQGSVVRAFKSRGWRWGGDWTSCKDYQHFDRPQ